jgi:thiol-disulfide isomerase/thioredoxin
LTESQKKPSNKWIQWVLTAVVFIAFYAWMTRGTMSPFLGEQAPALSLAVAAGAEPDGPTRVNLSEIRDEVVVLEFWASWCGACKRTTPVLNELNREFDEEPVAFYAVNVEPIDRQRLETAHVAFGAEFPTLHDRTGEVQRRYSIDTLPTVIVVDRAGVVRWASTGVPSKMRLRGAITEALN